MASCFGYFAVSQTPFYPIRRPFHNDLIATSANFLCNCQDYILKFFHDSTYVDLLELFVKGVEEKFESYGKVLGEVFRLDWTLYGLQPLFHDRIKATLCNARKEINADFTLLRTQTPAKHSEVREEVVGVPSFEHSEDFRSVSYFGKQYTLTPRQAEVIEILFKGWEKGTPEIGQDYILEELGTSSSRLRDTFKSSPSAWKDLIKPGEKRGTVRLNIK